MSGRLFLDTSGWFAAINPKESRFNEASAAYDAQLAAAGAFVTSNLVLAEMHALTVREQGTKAGCALIDAIYADPSYTIVTVDRDLETRAVDNWLRRFADARFSLTDAVSFQIMKEERISKAFTLDHHFAAAGFSLVPSSQRTPPEKSRKSKRK